MRAKGLNMTGRLHCVGTVRSRLNVHVDDGGANQPRFKRQTIEGCRQRRGEGGGRDKDGAGLPN